MTSEENCSHPKLLLRKSVDLSLVSLIWELPALVGYQTIEVRGTNTFLCLYTKTIIESFLLDFNSLFVFIFLYKYKDFMCVFFPHH